MKYGIYLIAALLAVASALSAAGATLQTKFEFAADTPLATGHWVKISIDATGLYEISYDELREMGFEDPSKVAVFGTGGEMLNYNFLDSSGKRLYDDTLNPTVVLHGNDKLIFYGGGTEQMTLSITGYSTTKRLKHNRASKNLYSDSSYYLLTDSQTPLEAERVTVADKAGAYHIDTGYGLVYHEKDKVYNRALEGQVYWGEELYVDQTVSFDVERPYCVDKPAYLWLTFACLSPDGTVATSVNNGKVTASLEGLESNVYSLGNSDDRARLTVGSDGIGRATIKVGLSGSYNSGLPLGIDCWTLSYPISLELARKDPKFSCQYVAFTDTPYTSWRHPVPEGVTVWDVTNRRKPVALEVENGYLYSNRTNPNRTVVFRPDREQLHINPDWKVIDNQNLHGCQTEPYSMVIVTVPSLRGYAERIARLHEDYDGMKVAVVTPEEVYNEFNHGTPDVTALRAFIKMIFHKQSESLKNVLLIGNIFADHRNVTGSPSRPESIPVYMLPKATLDGSKGAGGAACIDYLGILTDHMNSTGLLSGTTVELGVGVLPISTAEEGEIAVKKIGDYLQKKDFSNLVNEFQSMSGTGDSHIHDFQAFRLWDLYDEYSRASTGSTLSFSTIWVECMGNKSIKELLKSFDRGKLLTTYYGHSGNSDFSNVTPQHLAGLKNDEPAFMFMAGCDLCEPDRGRNGVGDIGVIRNTKGLMATICGTRSVLSHENQTFSENFVYSMFRDRNRAFRMKTPTIGEIYAYAKERTNNESEQGFIFIGDPALPFPLALRGINVTTDRDNYRGGEVMEVTGTVLGTGGSADTGYNGYVTVKLLEPKSTTAIIEDPIDSDGTVKMNPRLVINDVLVATATTEVTNGVFKARVQLPATLDRLLSTPDSVRNLTVLAGAYDPEKRLGSSGHTAVTMPMIGTEPSEAAIYDTTIPSVTISYDNPERRLTVTASDDTGLIPGIGTGRGLSVSIDGVPCLIDASSGNDDRTVTSYTAAISTAHLAAGRHEAVYSAVDAAGNAMTSRTYIFNIKDYAPLTLTAGSDIVTDEITLTIDRDDDLTLDLIVTDRHGNTVIASDFEGRSQTVDLSDLEPGTYRAAVRHDSRLGSMIYSNLIEFTKID